MESWCCQKCAKEFSRKYNLKCHMKACLVKHGHLCICAEGFSGKDNLKRHFKSCQGEQQHGGGDEKGPAAKKQKMDKQEEAGLRPTKEKQEPEASGQELWPSNNADEDDQLLVRVLDAVEKQLKQDQDQEQDDKIKFKLTPCTDKRCKKFGLQHKVYSLRLSQKGVGLSELDKIAGEDLWKMLEGSLQEGIAKVTSSHKDEDTMFLAMSSNRLHHTYHSPRLTVGDWRDSRLPARRVLEMMSAILNSNESFQLDDSFHVEISLVELPSRASGQLTLYNKSLDSLIRKKIRHLYSQHR